MADYVPNTMVKVLKDVPLDNTYTDTRWFSSLGEQISFFSGKTKYSFSNMSYQRVNNGIANPRVALTCRVPTLADNIYDCNYIMFQNNNFGSKWFYAFIKQVNYINPNNTEIVYEIDYLQTFMFELDIKASFVEREHLSSAEDIEFANLVPEPVGVSKWTEDSNNSAEISFKSITGSDTNYIVVGFMPSDLISSAISGTGYLINGIYSGCKYAVFTSVGAVNAALIAVGAVDMSQNIVGIWMTRVNPSGSSSSASTKTVIASGLNRKRLTFSTATGEYTARNKKLISSQFCYFKGFSLSGDEQHWLPELFVSDQPQFKVTYCASSDVNMLLVPLYESSLSGIMDTDNGLSFNESVQCVWASYGWINDGIKSIANKVKEKTAQTATAALAAGAIVATAGAATPAVAASSGTALATTSGSAIAPMSTSLVPVSTTVSQLPLSYSVSNMQHGSDSSNIEDFSNMFPSSAPRSGTASQSSHLTFSAGFAPYAIKRMCPTSDELERLDTFFDMFGYQINKVKVPNLDTRAAWNYVKLKKPCIYGSVPVEGMSIIKNAFANGIRLWHVDAVGDYSIENPPK